MTMHSVPAPIELKDAGEGDEATAVEKALADLQKTVDDRLKAVETKSAARLDEIEKRLARPAISRGGADEDVDEAASLEKKAFNTFLRHGREGLSADEIKSLRASDAAAGGYLAPPDFVTEVLKEIIHFSPIRQAARVGGTTAGQVILPKRATRPTAHWVAETDDRAETASSYAQVSIEIHESAAYVDVSQRLLEDAAVNVESEVAIDVAEEFGRLEGAAFVGGTGVGQPAGLLADTDVTIVKTGVADGMPATSTALIAMLNSAVFGLAPAYRGRSSWIMNGTTLSYFMGLSAVDGRPLWQQSLQDGTPSMLLGRPVIEVPDMPDIAANASPIMFGDFGTAYRIYDRVQLAMLRDPYTVATKGLVRFHARRRVGGKVVLPAALRRIKVSA